MNSHNEPTQPRNQGGYLIPEYLWTERPGTKAAIYRTAGRVLRNEELYHRGMIRHEFAKELRRLLERKQAIEQIVTITLHK